MLNRNRKTIAVTVLTLAVAFEMISCKRQSMPTTASNTGPIRVSGAIEPAELLITPEKEIESTVEMRAMLDAIKDIKGGNEQSQLPAVDAFISKHPGIGDMYVIRVELRCMKGDLSGAEADINMAFSARTWIVNDAKHSRNELTAKRAKLSYMKSRNAASLRDIQELIGSYSSDVQYLTEGRVKPLDRPNSVCAWGPSDVDSLIEKTHQDPSAVLFRGIYYAAFSTLDDDSKKVAERDLNEAVAASTQNADPYFYSAVGLQKSAAIKGLGFSDSERSAYDRRLIDLYSRAIALNAQIEEAYSLRADAYLTEHDSQRAIADYDQAIRIDPDDAGLWNDRGLAKEDTYDKTGAIEDFSHAIELKVAKGGIDAPSSSIENRGDLYMKLGNYEKALDDYTTLIGERIHGALLFINLDFFRELYPEYAGVDDTRLREKLHRMYYPNFSNDDFKKTMDNPRGMRPSIDGELPEAYLKRADALLAMKDFQRARFDYERSHKFPNQFQSARWRQPASLPKLEIDLQTLNTRDLANETVWIRSPVDDRSADAIDPTEFAMDCSRRSIRVGAMKSAVEAPPGSREESILDYFCSAETAR